MDNRTSEVGQRPTSDSDCLQSPSEAQHNACRWDGPDAEVGQRPASDSGCLQSPSEAQHNACRWDGPDAEVGQRPTSDSDCLQSPSEAQHNACRWDGPDTLAEWLREYGDLINRTCFLILGDRALAEDATQETFLRAWKSMAHFKGNASPRTWLTRIAINVCRNIRRTAWFRRNDRSITPEDLPLTAPDEDRTLFLTVQQLPEKQRQIIVLRYYQGMSLDEAARVLGVSRSSAHHRLQKALKQLRIELDEGRDEHD